jgi:hypothetical protein
MVITVTAVACCTLTVPSWLGPARHAAGRLLWPDDGVRPLMPGVLLVAEADAPWVRQHCFAMGSRGYLRAAFTDRLEARLKCNTFARIHEEFDCKTSRARD